MNFLAYGDQGLVVEFEPKIDPDIHRLVMAWYRTIREASIPGIHTLIPAYHSLTIGFLPEAVRTAELIKSLEALEVNIDPASTGEMIHWRVPVCYDDENGQDLTHVAKMLQRSIEAVIELHTRGTYLVYLLGFLPGFPYMGILPEELNVSRHKVPRLQVPAGSVGLAQRQTGIYPCTSPGGWQIIGRTPISLFDVAVQDFLFHPGDSVRFYSITAEEYDEWRNKLNGRPLNREELYD